ncbi:tRNA pseudouridine(13) synthase TruD [Neptunicella sp. SCSIO 80796]|uniref:tRNA pseudouridine(13) synthase TruD n=1 Tax=Neptunicella plasticusilytica TaxID=3117012 RepID=UPI003A4D8A8B
MTAQLTLSTDHWLYLHGKPVSSGTIKSCPQDFQVTEIPAYPLTGEGEHIYLWIEKSQLNTAYVAEQLASFTGLPLRAISYAGRKDKYALTQQFFAVHLPGNHNPDWNTFDLSGAKVLSATRHNKKLRTGALKGNRFSITIRELDHPEQVTERLALISRFGVPNYYGEQRFGNQNSNLHLAQKLVQGEVIRNRNKRSMCISALRSWLFNQTISHRIGEKLFSQPIAGDVMKLAGSNSFFVAEQIDDVIEQRIQSGDIQLSAPLWGTGKLASSGTVAELEQRVATEYSSIANTLEKLKLVQERRAIDVKPANLDWKLDANTLTIAFDLPAGCFATSILRELIQFKAQPHSDQQHTVAKDISQVAS